MIKDSGIQPLTGTGGEIKPAKDGHFTLKIGGQSIHSNYSPYKEAHRLVEPLLDLDTESTLVIVFGTGLGYHIDILERHGFRSIIVIERDPAVYNVFLHVYDVSGLKYIISPEDGIEKLDSIFSEADIQNFKSIKTVALRGAYRKELYADLEDRIERLMKVKLGDFATRLRFEELWFTHILKNLPNLEWSYPVSSLLSERREFPVAIVSAGPSLKDSLETIRRIKPKVILIAVDTALMPLYESGIVPDFVYSLDSQSHNLIDFSMIASDYLEQINLVYDMVVHPSLPERFPGGKFAANTAHVDFDYDGNPIVIKSEWISWLEKSSGFRIGDIETGGSVATSSFHFAYLLGATEIILFGQDLAYTNLVSHACSTPHYHRLLRRSNRLSTIESGYMNILKKRNAFPVEGTKGRVWTDFVLNNFRGWFEESARSVSNSVKRIRLINATANGAKIQYFEGVSADTIDTVLKDKPEIDRTEFFRRIQMTEPSKLKKIAVSLAKMAKFVNDLIAGDGLFRAIEASEYGHLNRYFMKEKMVFERYGKVESAVLERKLKRLKKNLDGVLDAFR